MSKTNKWPDPNMILVSGTWGPTDTFKLIPITESCPYIECIFNPQGKILAVIGNNKKDAFHMVPKLDENGNQQDKKGTAASKEDPLKKQRVSLETYSEYYITNTDEIAAFVSNIAVNASDFDISKYLKAPTMEAPSASGIQTPPLIIQP